MVLGYGLHTIEYKSQQIWVHYREIFTPTPVERLTLFAKPNLIQINVNNVLVSQSNDPQAANSNQSQTMWGWELLKSFLNEALDFSNQIADGKHECENPTELLIFLKTNSKEVTKILTVDEKRLAWQISTEKTKRPLDSVFINKQIKKELVEDLR